MLIKNQHDGPFPLFLKSGSQGIRAAVDLLPCATALWSPDHDLRILNSQASELLGFSELDLREDPTLWISRIYPRDRRLFSVAWKKLQEGEKVVSCDYRFSPKRGERDTWIRDVSFSFKNPLGEVEGVTSAYMDISDLKERLQKSQGEGRDSKVVGIITGLIHEVQNYLQIISGELDLSSSSRGMLLEQTRGFNAIMGVNKSVQELREYFFPPHVRHSKIDTAVILRAIVREMETKLREQGVHLRVDWQGSLPSVRFDLRQFRNVIERVMEFSRALLPKGGELEIEARLKEIDRQKYLELHVVSSSSTSLGVEEKDIFQPYLRVNGHQVGLGIVLADQILRRHKGKITFQKENPKRGLFTILLQTC